MTEGGSDAAIYFFQRLSKSRLIAAFTDAGESYGRRGLPNSHCRVKTRSASPLLTHQMRVALLVFIADELDHVRPRLGVRLGILYRHLDLHASVIHTPEPLGHLPRVGQWAPLHVQPHIV